MQKDTLLNRVFDRGLLLFIALVLASASWLFFNITGEHAFLFLLFVWFLISFNDAKKLKALKAENEQLKKQLNQKAIS